jgi:pilus assembly protein Flp/PilA
MYQDNASRRQIRRRSGSGVGWSCGMRGRYIEQCHSSLFITAANDWGVALREMEMNASISKFLREEDGITALEYGILAALVATVLGITFAPALSTLYTSLFSTMTSAVTTAATSK